MEIGLLVDNKSSYNKWFCTGMAL